MRTFERILGCYKHVISVNIIGNKRYTHQLSFWRSKLAVPPILNETYISKLSRTIAAVKMNIKETALSRQFHSSCNKISLILHSAIYRGGLQLRRIPYVAQK